RVRLARRRREPRRRPHSRAHAACRQQTWRVRHTQYAGGSGDPMTVDKMAPMAITMGDASGVGPEIVLRRAAEHRPGEIDAAAGAAAREYVLMATRDAQDGKVAGIVTMPMNKEATQLS